MFKNKKIFILGMARSGYEVAKVLAKKNNKIIYMYSYSNIVNNQILMIIC